MDWSLKHSMIQTNNVLRKRLKMLTDTAGLVKKTDYNTNIAEIENKMPSVTGLVTAAALKTKTTGIESKIFDFNNLTEKLL